MAENKSNITQNIKIALIGDSGVGKSSIALRYTMNEFNDNYNSTGGASYSTKIIQYGNDTIQLDIWDTAGQEKFRSLGRQFYKDAFIVILVYDITNKQTFINLSKIWYPELKNSGESNPVIGVAGNKSDQYESEETVNEEEARKYSESINGVFELVSAKTGNNIDNIFERSVKQIDQNILDNKYDLDNENCGIRKGLRTESFVLSVEKSKEKKKKKCC